MAAYGAGLSSWFGSTHGSELSDAVVLFGIVAHPVTAWLPDSAATSATAAPHFRQGIT